MHLNTCFHKMKHQLASVLGVLLVCSVMVSMIPAAEVSAYKTTGALGRNLNVAAGFAINRNMLAFPNTLCRSGQTLTDFEGVTIHETSNWAYGANAALHAAYLRGTGRDYEVSWHYSVDSTCAYQSIPENEKAWHAGDTGRGTGNAKTIAIEICDNAGGNFDQAMANAEWLAADILYRHGVYSVSNHLFQHNQFSAFQKNCPITIRDTGRWQEFSAKTQMYLDQMVAANGSYQIEDTNGIITITGTPVSTNAVSHVDIYDENFRFIGSAPTVNGSIGYSFDSAFFTVGWHVFQLAVLDISGTEKWLTFTYQVGPESQMFLDYPAGDSLTYGDVTVSGWAVSHAGISRVDIYMDDMIWIGSTPNMLCRWDVGSGVNSAGHYKDALYSGFSYTIDESRLSEGPHILKVAAISYDGTVQWYGRSFTVGPKALMCLDQPRAGELGGDITVSGWAVSLTGVSNIDIYVDDLRWIGSTSNMQTRNDVNNIINNLGQYEDALFSGFTYDIDAGLLTPGAHTLKVAATSNDGSVQWLESSFVVGPASQAYLDNPNSLEVDGDITVSGWAVSHAGIERVDIYADDNRGIGCTSEMYERSDVNDVVNTSGKYKDALHSGFSYTIEEGVLSPGTHELKIAMISKDGTAQWVVKTIVVQ